MKELKKIGRTSVDGYKELKKEELKISKRMTRKEFVKLTEMLSRKVDKWRRKE